MCPKLVFFISFSWNAFRISDYYWLLLLLIDLYQIFATNVADSQTNMRAIHLLVFFFEKLHCGVSKLLSHLAQHLLEFSRPITIEGQAIAQTNTPKSVWIITSHNDDSLHFRDIYLPHVPLFRLVAIYFCLLATIDAVGNSTHPFSHCLLQKATVRMTIFGPFISNCRYILPLRLKKCKM